MLAVANEQATGAFSYLAVLPPAAVGLAVVALSQGSWLAALALMAWGAVGILLAGWVWVWALARRLDGGGGGLSAKERLGPTGDWVLYPRSLSWLPRTAVGSVVAKEYRYYFFRSTLQLQQLVLGTIIAVLVAAQTLFSADPGPTASFLGAFVVFMVLWQSAPNVFGIDNASISVYLLTGVRLRDVLLGKMLALLLIMLPVAVVLQVAASAVHSTWSTLYLGIAAIPIPWLLWVGLGSQISVRAGFPLIPGHKPNSAKAVTAVLGSLVGGLVLVAVVVGAGVGVYLLTASELLAIVIAWLLALVIGFIGFRSAATLIENNPTRLLVELGGDKL